MQAAATRCWDLTAADLMTASVLTIPQNTPLREAAQLLSGRNISGAPVVDPAGTCVGVLSSSDFVRWAGKEGEQVSFIAPWGEVIDVEGDPDNEIRHYMTAKLVTVSRATPFWKLAQKMVDSHIHRLLVVDDQNRFVGIVSSTDVLAAVAREGRGGVS